MNPVTISVYKGIQNENIFETFYTSHFIPETFLQAEEFN